MAFDPSCIDVEDYLGCLGFENIERATEREFRFSCPYPDHASGDQRPSAYMNVYTTAFFCHSCHRKGNAITLAANVLKVSPLEATRLLRQRYSLAGVDPDSRSMVEEVRKILDKPEVIKRANRIMPESALDKYCVHWYTEKMYVDAGIGAEWAKYIFERGFSVQTLIDWQFGYDSDSKRITLPIRDEDGFLVGIKARAYDGRKPKYLNMRDRNNDVEPYLKNEIVFGLRRADIHDGHLIVVEGEYDAVIMHQMGYQNTVAINGSYFGERQMRLIIRKSDRVTLFFDSDSAGKDASRVVGERLRPYVSVRVVPDHHGDPMTMHAVSVRRCIERARPFREYLMRS